jgi:hypothetical protein
MTDSMLERVERFWAKVCIGEPDQCWEWTAGRNKTGYGQVTFLGKGDRAHRVSWRLANDRDIPKGMCICHACDNPACCNPSHLWLGTVGDNNRDKTAKGRNVRPPRDETQVRYIRGEGIAKAKLTEEDVLEIRRRRALGETLTSLGRAFGVDMSTIGYVVRGKVWKHVGTGR